MISKILIHIWQEALLFLKNFTVISMRFCQKVECHKKGIQVSMAVKNLNISSWQDVWLDLLHKKSHGYQIFNLIIRIIWLLWIVPVHFPYARNTSISTSLSLHRGQLLPIYFCQNNHINPYLSALGFWNI